MKELLPLQIGDSVSVQNQAGTRPNKWTCTGIISEVLPYRQYRVIMDGSRRVTLRNRRFLRKISPVCGKGLPAYDTPETPILEKTTPQVLPTDQRPLELDHLTSQNNEDIPSASQNNEEITLIPPITNLLPGPSTEDQSQVPTDPTPALRRGSRTRVKTMPFIARMDGKYHQ